MEAVSNFECETDKHRKARYAVFKNLSKYRRAVEVAEDALEKPSEKMQEYWREKTAIAKRCGGVQTSNGEIPLNTIKDIDEYNRETQKLDMKYADELTKNQKKMDNNQKMGLLEVEDTPDPFYADYDWFPDSVSAKKLTGIEFMLRPSSEYADEGMFLKEAPAPEEEKDSKKK